MEDEEVLDMVDEDFRKKEEDDIRKRIEEVLLIKKIKYTSITGMNSMQTKFFRQVRQNAHITTDIICAILSYIPDLSAEWLLMGRGSMLKTSEGTTYNVNMSEGVQTVGNNNKQTVNTSSDKDLLQLLKEQQKQMGDLINLMAKTNG